MKTTTQIKIEMEDFDKCSLNVNSDCSLGQLYDFSCAFQNFVINKMQEAEKNKPVSSSESEDPKE
jgi:hypothetical protein